MYAWDNKREETHICFAVIWFAPPLFPLLASSKVNDIETKAQTFRYQILLSEQEQNVLIWNAYYRTESKKILFGPKIIQGGSDKSGILILFFFF